MAEAQKVAGKLMGLSPCREMKASAEKHFGRAFETFDGCTVHIDNFSANGCVREAYREDSKFRPGEWFTAIGLYYPEEYPVHPLAADDKLIGMEMPVCRSLSLETKMRLKEAGCQIVATHSHIREEIDHIHAYCPPARVAELMALIEKEIYAPAAEHEAPKP